MEFSRQKYWSGLPCVPPGDLPTPGGPRDGTSLVSTAPAPGKCHPGGTWEAHILRKAQSCLHRITRLFLCSYWKGTCQSLSHIQLFVTPWTVARQVHPCMGFSRRDYWSGLPCPPPRDLPHPGIEPSSLSLLHWQVGYLPLVSSEKPFIWRKAFYS